MNNMLLPQELMEQGILYFKAGRYDDAEICWRKSADMGIASSMFCLGLLCLKENSTDISNAKEWFKKADKIGHKNARLQLENIEKFGVCNKSIDELFRQIKETSQKINRKIINFGGYSWYVLKQEYGYYLCLSQYLIDIKRFHNTNKIVTWKESDIRYWLNNNFYNTFNNQDKNFIQEVIIENSDNLVYGTKAGNNTKDHIFLLSYNEVVDNFNICNLVSSDQNIDDLIAFVNMKPECIIADSKQIGLDYHLAQGQALGWWLRTPGASQNKMIRINCRGAIRMYGRDVNRCLVGIRPALWLNVEYETKVLKN